MFLQIGPNINIPNFTLCKIMTYLIEEVTQRALREEMNRLKFFNKNKETILLTPIDLIAGVGEGKSEEDYSYYVPSNDD